MRHEPAPSREWVEDDAVLGLDNVRLELPIAGAGSRVLAGFIDYAILGALMTAWVILFFAGMVWLRLQSGWFFAVLLLGLFLLDWGYFAGFEVALGGRTPGKAAVGLCVATRTGGKPGAPALLIRNLVRTVDLLVGVPMMALDPLARRLGDRLAGTLVVHRRKERVELVLERLPASWGAREGALLESFLGRVDGLEPERARHLAERIIAWIERDDPELSAIFAAEADPVERLKKALLDATTNR